MTEAVIALGANLGDREDALRRATQAIDRLPRTTVVKVSPYYETEPFEVPEPQNDYVNACIKLETGLAPDVLLGAALGIEAAMGKVRTHRNAARVIDIDLLLYGDVRMATDALILPHPRMLERAFVLVPLADLYPDGVALGVPFAERLRRLDTSGVRRAT